MIRRIASWLATITLLLATVFAGMWVFGSTALDNWEPLITGLALMAAFVGVPVERWAATRERRETLAMMIRQIQANLQTIESEMAPMTKATVRRAIYPRLMTSFLATALTSGVFSFRDDSRVFEAVLTYQQEVAEFNHRLDLTELFLFSNLDASSDVMLEFDRALHRPDGHLRLIIDSTSRLMEVCQEELRTLTPLRIQPQKTTTSEA